MDAAGGCDEGLAAVTTGRAQNESSPAPVEGVRIGAFVLCPVGCAHNMIREEEAVRTLRLLAEAGLTVGEPA